MATAKGYLAPSLIAAGGAAAHLYASSRFRRDIASAVAQIDSGVAAIAAPRRDLPDPIAAFLHRAAPLTARVPLAILLRQHGEMRFPPRGKWRPFTAEQTIAIHEPGFVWHALCDVMPLVTAEVFDSYVGVEGRLEARLFGSVRVAKAAGPQTARAELMRYLAELAWVPDAIRYNPALRWRALDHRTFEVSADAAGGEARVCLIFNENGDIAGMKADDRPRTEGSKTVSGKWFGAFSGHKTLAGYRIPLCGEVGWELDTGRFTYWRGEIKDLHVRFAG